MRGTPSGHLEPERDRVLANPSISSRKLSAANDVAVPTPRQARPGRPGMMTCSELGRETDIADRASLSSDAVDRRRTGASHRGSIGDESSETDR